jgi:hypothetical protein
MGILQSDERLIVPDPYSVPFPDIDGTKRKLSQMAKCGIAVYWSDSSRRYNEFFSKGFRNNSNGCFVTFTTSVMAEGLDYPNVGTVVIYGGGDFYIKHHILTRDRLDQMIGRTGRNYPGCAVLHESLRELYTKGNSTDFSYTHVRHNTDVCELFHEDLLGSNSIDTSLLVNFRVFYEYSCDRLITQLRRFCTGDAKLDVVDIANVLLVGGTSTEIIPSLMRISNFNDSDTTYGIFVLPFVISIFAYRDILSMRDDSDHLWRKPDWKLRMNFVVHDPFSFMIDNNGNWGKPDWSKNNIMWTDFHERRSIADHFNNTMEISEFNILRPKINFAKLEDVIMAFNDIDIDPKYFRYMWSFT